MFTCITKKGCIDSCQLPSHWESGICYDFRTRLRAMVRSYIMYLTDSIMLTGSCKKIKESFFLMRFSKPRHIHEHMCIAYSIHPLAANLPLPWLSFWNNTKCFHKKVSLIQYLRVLPCKYKNDTNYKSVFPVSRIPHIRKPTYFFLEFVVIVF